MKLKVKLFFSQKLGNEPNEYEDSFYYNLAKRKFAIADGVSESCFAKLWADLLTKHFVESNISLFSVEEFSCKNIVKVLQSFVLSAQKEWNQKINWKDLPWYVEEKTRKGAFATFLGLELKIDYYKEDQYLWRAVAIGDCCLFQINGKQLITSFPIFNSTQFSNTPPMISSKLSFDAYECKICAMEGIVEANEKIILATDAIAKWILQRIEANQWTWRKKVLLCGKKLRFLLDELIQNNKMRNDDITLAVVFFRSS